MLGLDTETEKFGPGNMAPRMACLTLAYGDRAELFHQSEVDLPLLYDVLRSPIVGQNIAYDMAVLCRHVPRIIGRVFRAYRAGIIHDTMLREQLIDISRGQLRAGKYSLAQLAHKYFDTDMDKETYRLSYGELIDVPLYAWSEGHKRYAIGDAKMALDIYHAQEAAVADDGFPVYTLEDACRQSAYAWAYRLMTVWGMHTDARRVADLKRRTVADMHALEKRLIELGLMRVKLKGKHKGKVTRNMAAIREAVVAAYGKDAPLTPKGQISTAAEVMHAHANLKPVSDYVSLQKLNSTYITVLEEGAGRYPIQAEFHLLVTGRRGASKNAQTLPTTGGVRECYVPRDGYVLATIDYNTVELRAWAQVMVDLFGIDKVPMAQMYQADPDADPHTKFAAEHFLGITYEQGLRLKASADRAKAEGRELTADEKSLKRFRQASKAANFGFPGGLGIERFVEFARTKHNHMLTEKEAEEIKRGWLKTWNARLYFDKIAQLEMQDGFYVQHRSNRVRGGLGFCDMANTPFQALTADGCFASLFDISEQAYTQRRSPLWGTRPVDAAHDEIVLEIPNDRPGRASNALLAAERLMVKGMQSFCPDVPIRVEGALMDRWTKDAARIVNADGSIGVFHVR